MYQQFPDPSIVDKSFQEHFDIPNKTMYDIVHDMALLRPSEEALSFLNARMSFRALDRAIDDCAKGLIQMGFKKGDVVAICLPNIPETVVLFYAVNRLGGVSNMIHPLAPAAQLMEIIH